MTLDLEAIKSRSQAVTECDIEHVYADRRALVEEVERLRAVNGRLRDSVVEANRDVVRRIGESLDDVNEVQRLRDENERLNRERDRARVIAIRFSRSYDAVYVAFREEERDGIENELAGWTAGQPEPTAQVHCATHDEPPKVTA